jgi:hypothetical protein
MSFKILYIEDLEPGSIVHNLSRFGFEVTHYVPKTFEETISKIKDFDLLLFDFRLTETTAFFDAPTIASTIRTINSTYHYDVPIVLISSEDKICDYYKDYTSQNLFDLSITKKNLLIDLPKYSIRFQSLIKSYKLINEKKFNINELLNISGPENYIIDYRITEKLKSQLICSNVFAFSNFILNNLIRTIGPLIGEDVLSARLGISKSSSDWESLKSNFESFKYKGIFSDSYDRWWNEGLINWWKAHNDGKNNLRILNSDQRKSILAEKLNIDLSTIPLTKYAFSSAYWTICKELFLPIDPIDGLELNRRELLVWQDKEYISIQAAIEPTQFDSVTGVPVFNQFIKPIDKVRLKEIIKSL